MATNDIDNARARDLMRRACELRVQVKKLDDDIRHAAREGDSGRVWSYAKAEARAEDAADNLWIIACTIGAEHGLDASDVDPDRDDAEQPEAV